jgi:hypothetical protein
MAANTSPLFTATPNNKSVAVPATAETSLTAPVNVVKALTGGANGTRVEGLAFKARGSTTAGMLRIYHRIADAGTYLLIGEVPVSAVTPSASVAAWAGAWRPQVTPFVLPATDCLYVATNNAEAFTATPVAGDF